MYLQPPPSSFIELHELVTRFNKVLDSDPTQQLFYLQKINFVLNKTKLNEDLFHWINGNGVNCWRHQLESFGINANASFFYKGIQFAHAIAQYQRQAVEIHHESDEYDLMKHRDQLIKNQSYEECKDDYIKTNLNLHRIANTNPRLIKMIEKQSEVLHLAHSKFEAIKGQMTTKNSSYYTEPLGNVQMNNYHFKFTMAEWKDPFVFRVEDRSELGLEQELHSYKAAEYYLEDYAVFMMAFKKGDDDDSVEFKPVVLSQFANQGNLADVAKKLKKESQAKIATGISHYFVQLTDLCQKLIDEGIYHPDIKLTNFLVHNNKLLISDRKTLINIRTPKVTQVRSTPLFAPNSYLECLNNTHTGYRFNADKTTVYMPQFMAYQLGMALKEFMIWTQRDELPDAFRHLNKKTSSYFTHPGHLIVNLSLLIQELTREDATKRLSIEQLKTLIIQKTYLQNPDNFYRKIEEILPSNALGIEDDLNKIESLLTPNNMESDQFLEQANKMFKYITESSPKEPRLVRMAEKLALKCFTEYSQQYFMNLSNAIETALINRDWAIAPWYRKAIHYLTFGLYRVDRVSEGNTIQIALDFKSKEFQTHFPQLHFLAPAQLEKFGQQESIHFQDFIVSHLNEIESKESNIGQSVDSKKDDAVIIDCSSSEPSFCDRVSIEQDDSDSIQSDPDNDKQNPVVLLIDEDSSLESESVNIKPDTPNIIDKNLGFFKDIKTSENELEDPTLPKVKRFSVRSTLFLGDGIDRYDQSERKKRSEIKTITDYTIPINREFCR